MIQLNRSVTVVKQFGIGLPASMHDVWRVTEGAVGSALAFAIAGSSSSVDRKITENRRSNFMTSSYPW
jgi:hypothetical protein